MLLKRKIMKIKGSGNNKIIASVLGVSALVAAIVTAKKIHGRLKEEERVRNNNL